MSGEKPENPSLFALLEDGEGRREFGSEITLRDLFAAAIVAGWCAHPNVDAQDTDRGWRERFAGDAYDMADAMLAERAK